MSTDNPMDNAYFARQAIFGRWAEAGRPNCGSFHGIPHTTLLAMDANRDYERTPLDEHMERVRAKVVAHALPSDPKVRKAIPIATGVLDYFPDAIAAVADCSRVGNDQHNPGQPLHWAKEKSTDHADCIVRHLIDRGKRDGDGVRHSAKVAWRALALLQTELEKEAQDDPFYDPRTGRRAGDLPTRDDYPR